jgi:hypothetical protein
MFRTSWGPSSGSRELRLTEVTSFGSVLAISVCAVNIWLRSTALTSAIGTHTKG